MLPARLYCPTPQLVQFVFLSSYFSPALQVLQLPSIFRARLYCPTGQSVQALSVSLYFFPATQVLQSLFVFPASDEYFPGEQGMHVSFPDKK
jgi:hypothetical protein